MSNRGGRTGIWRQRADGSAPAESLLTSVNGPIMEVHPAPGGSLIYRVDSSLVSGSMSRDIFLLPRGAPPRALLASRHEESGAALSPDGRWLAYQSGESGQTEVYVRPFPNVESARWQVSTHGGGDPRWAHSGRELFFESAAGELMAVPVAPGPTFKFGAAVRLLTDFGTEFFESTAVPFWDVTPDDRRFLVMRTSGWDSTGTRLILVDNLADEARLLLRGPVPR